MTTVFQRLVHDAVAQYVDPWADKGIEKLPAEKVTRYTYVPAKGEWQSDISLIKMEAKPFDKGAQRQVYRMKKISQAPTAHWKKDPLDWKKAPNYVVKCYITPDGSMNAHNSRDRCFLDVQVQYEASFWASQFNKAGPPKHIKVIQCNVLELTSREGSPVVGCERFVDGHDKHGDGFVKHNSNSGFVDDNQSRSTPQAFSAHSFYESQGKYMVVDIQGVGDLYTDPQIHSQDTKFGHSDLGVRGMALFFVSFRRNPVCDALKLPRFPLSVRERARIQAGSHAGSVSRMTGLREDASDTVYADIEFTATKDDMIQLEKVLAENPKFHALSITEQRIHLESSWSDEDRQEVEAAILAAHSYAQRVQSALLAGEFSARNTSSVEKSPDFLFDQFVKFKPNVPATWTAKLQLSTAEVHLEIAVLEAAGRFATDEGLTSSVEDMADVSSCLFHLCEASLLGSCAAALVLGRLRAGLGTDMLEVLSDYVEVDNSAALAFFQLAAVRGSVVGAWQAAQIHVKDEDTKQAVFMCELALELMGVSASSSDEAEEESEEHAYTVGERVEGNYCGCGTWYEASVLEKIPKADGETIYFIKYTVDGEEETVSEDNIRPIDASSLDLTGEISSSVSEDSATNPTGSDSIVHDVVPCPDAESSASGSGSGSGSDESGTGAGTGSSVVEEPTASVALDEISAPVAFKSRLSIGEDGSFVPEVHEVYAELGKLHSILDNNELACQYFNDAAEAAMEAGKPKLANTYIEKASLYE